MLLRLAMGLRVHHHLMLRVHSHNTDVALNHPTARLHLGALVVRDVALDRFAARSDLLLVSRQKLLQLPAHSP